MFVSKLKNAAALCAAPIRGWTARLATVASWRRSGLRPALAAGVAVVLAGCAASPFSARVTTFQQWPADAVGQSFRFGAAPAEVAGSLEYRSYQDMLRGALSGIGLTEVQAWERDARFTVSFDYAVQPFDTWAETDAFYAAPVFSYGYYGRGGPGFGWGYNMMFPFGAYPHTRTVPVTAYRATLELAINDRNRGGAQVFQAKARHDGADPDALPRIMPYLVQAVFTDFPQASGQTRTVHIPRP